MRSNFRRGSMGLIPLAALLVGLTGCPMDEATCRNTYGLIKSAECPPPPPPPHAPPGPTITIKKKLTGGDVLYWLADDTEQTFNGSVFPDCTLRDDFIGLRISTFEVVHENGAIPRAKRVILESADTKVEIQKTSLGTVRWIVTDKLNSKICLSLSPSGSTGGNEIPVELRGFQVGECKAETLDTCVTDAAKIPVKLQVEMP